MVVPKEAERAPSCSSVSIASTGAGGLTAGGGGLLVCGTCGKSFTLQRLLNRHLKCHSSTKRYICAFCGKGADRCSNFPPDYGDSHAPLRPLPLWRPRSY